jgi:hypothetical protein
MAERAERIRLLTGTARQRDGQLGPPRRIGGGQVPADGHGIADHLDGLVGLARPAERGPEAGQGVRERRPVPVGVVVGQPLVGGHRVAGGLDRALRRPAALSVSASVSSAAARSGRSAGLTAARERRMCTAYSSRVAACWWSPCRYGHLSAWTSCSASSPPGVMETSQVSGDDVARLARRRMDDSGPFVRVRLMGP